MWIYSYFRNMDTTRQINTLHEIQSKHISLVVFLLTEANPMNGQIPSIFQLPTNSVFSGSVPHIPQTL